MRRFLPLDAVRGFSITYVIFIHTAIYNYTDFDTLLGGTIPLGLLALGLVSLWGGLFVVHCLVVNIVSSLRRSGGLYRREVGYLLLAGASYVLVLSVIQSLLLGRWSVNGSETQLTVVAELLRGQSVNLHFEKLFAGSGIKAIGVALLIVPAAVYGLFRRRGLKNQLENYQILLLMGVLALALTFVRVPLYGIWQQAIDQSNWLVGLAGSLFLADPYPGIIYISYGFFGTALGLMLYHRRRDLLMKYALPLAIVLMMVGFIGLMMVPVSFFGATYSWYFRVIAEAGFFILVYLIAVWISLRQQSHRPRPSKAVMPLVVISQISLTAYLFETLTSELLRHAWLLANPNFSTSIVYCLWLGAANAGLWLAIAHFWQRVNFVGSIEQFWVYWMGLFGKKSTKLQSGLGPTSH